ncbi:hypothetical protein [Anoxynatronum buryatiense]|uniref:Uncharacterized protein n=1 Tax=Anoxynatronum buryatiense TaxID=489973 RepID=A0AA46AIV3_9CLOT|nr:hypothetical protein [Anoxynatronum buryatiense]SMP54334.1 hypothetical protein SAMN06296020_105117 [Anoxynatronum buryatiense]
MKTTRFKSAGGEGNGRFMMAMSVMAVAGVTIIILALILVFFAYKRDDMDTAKWVMAATLPVLGTWVGTVLTYYFSRDNFEVANRTFTETAERLSDIEKLGRLSVCDNYIPVEKIVHVTMTQSESEADIKLVGGIIALLDRRNKNRLPILSSRGHVQYIVHRSMIDRYLTQKMLKGYQGDLNKLTFADLLKEDEEMKRIFSEGFGVIAQRDTMADAKKVMDRIPDCLDVFITKAGTRDETISGWVTDKRIMECARM